VGEYQGRPFLVMDLFKGQSLKERIAEKPVAVPELATVARQVSAALETAHARANAAKYNLDPARFAAWGPSAGWHLAALLGAKGDVQAVIDFFGPTDIARMDNQRLPNGMVHNDPNSPESQLLGGPLQQKREEAKAANPINFINATTPPFLIVHGDKDP
jgi:acetyl esterase/lipase